jgi:hypothetical protein
MPYRFWGLLDSCLAANALEPRLTRHGYTAKTLAELLDTKPAEIRSFLNGNLTPARTQELQNNLLAIGIPL